MSTESKTHENGSQQAFLCNYTYITHDCTARHYYHSQNPLENMGGQKLERGCSTGQQHVLWLQQSGPSVQRNSTRKNRPLLWISTVVLPYHFFITHLSVTRWECLIKERNLKEKKQKNSACWCMQHCSPPLQVKGRSTIKSKVSLNQLCYLKMTTLSFICSL